MGIKVSIQTNLNGDRDQDLSNFRAPQVPPINSNKMFKFPKFRIFKTNSFKRELREEVLKRKVLGQDMESDITQNLCNIEMKTIDDKIFIQNMEPQYIKIGPFSYRHTISSNSDLNSSDDVEKLLLNIEIKWA